MTSLSFQANPRRGLQVRALLVESEKIFSPGSLGIGHAPRPVAYRLTYYTCALRRVTGWRRSRVTEPANTASASTINFACASFGAIAARLMLR